MIESPAHRGRKLKVLQVGKYYPPVRGGIETHLEMLSRGLQASGEVEVEVVVAQAGRHSQREILHGVPVHRLGTILKLAGAPICFGLRRAIRRARADLVHLHVPHPAALLTYLFSGSAGRLVCTYHSDIIRQRVLGRLIAPLQDLAFGRSEAILSASQKLVDSSAVLARHRNRCVVIPFGTDAAAVADPPGPGLSGELRRRFPPPITLAVGRLVYYKGFEHLLRAMVLARAPGTLLIIGEGPMRPALESLIASTGLAGRAHLLGDVPDPAPYYQACDVFVLPSVARNEAFGLVQLEAMASGKPVINTWLDTGVPSVSLDGVTGLTVAPADPAALAGALTRLLGDAGLRARCGAAGRARVEAEFTAGKMVERREGVNLL